jgi:streptomycin 3"-kinase
MTDLVRAFGLEAWRPVTIGESGAIVRRSPDGARFAKVVDVGSIPALKAERDRVAWLGGQGIPGPSVFAWRERDIGACLVTSAVPGVGADRLSPADLLQAWAGIGRAVRHLHDLPVAACPFRDHDLLARMTLARDVVARGAVNPDFLPQIDRGREPAVILAELEHDLRRAQALEADDLVVGHGDPCLPNIMVDPETLAVTGLIDLGRLGVADRHADLALLVANARETWPDEAVARAADAALADAYGMPFDPERLAFYLRLDPLTWG